MQAEVIRPEAEKKKIHSKDQFELCYLRHQYFRRVKYNPTLEEMKPFMPIASYMAKNTYSVYKNLFNMVGFEVEDIINIANVHLVSFLGLYSLDKMPEKYNDFINKFKGLQNRVPDEVDLLDKNQANLTLFLKQRMEDVVRVCRQKARNIKGLPSEEYYYYYGPKKPPKIKRDLIKNYEKLGFRKLDTAVYKSIKKKVGTLYGSTFLFNDNYYVAVPLEQKSLKMDDFSGAGMNPHDNIHNMNPEDAFFIFEDGQVWEQRQKEFTNKPCEIKVNIIRNFIKTNRNNKAFREEIKTARKLLKELQ
jgi:hypothetical protein